MMPPPMLATVTTYAPTRCGIARFSASLLAELQGLGTRVDVVRLVQPGETPAAPGSGVVFEFDPGSSLSVEIARHRLQRYDGVVIQHEFGIYGPDHGSSVVDLLEELKPASVVVLHTVLTKPRAEERRITHDLADRATVLVVPSHSARILLEDEYGIPAEQVTVIPHGSAWQPAPPTGSAHRRRILTWGLLGPGKGIERAIAAIAQLKDLDPAPIYTVVGQTHPQVARREGFAYRDRLHEMVDDLGLVGQVEFDDGYKSDDDLYRLVAASDVIVVPYDNCEQVCSGVLTEAVSVGRPVVATSFPHARELLGSGAGMVIDHDDLSAFSAAIRTFLTDDVAYRRAVEMARRQALNLSWSNVAGRYQALLDRLTSTLAVG